MAQSISEVVDVSAEIRAAGQVRRDFGRVLMLTTDAPRSGRTVGKVATYATQDALEADWDPTSRPGEAASIYFRQIPYPKPLLIGQWDRTVMPSGYAGAGTIGAIAAIQALAATGELTFLGQTLTLGDLTAVADNAAVAVIVRAALRANATFTVFQPTVLSTTNRFVITFGAHVATGQVLDIPAGSVFTGNAAALLGLDSGTITQGRSAETLSDAMAAIRALESDFYFVGLDESLADTTAADDLVDWTETRTYMAALETSGADALVTGDRTSRSAILTATDATRSLAVWNDTLEQYKALSLAGRMSAVNFSAANSYITANLKQLPGTTPSNLEGSQTLELDRKAINYTTRIGGVPVLSSGVTLDGGFIDVRYWLDWFKNAMQTDVFNGLLQSRIPQTDAGTAVLANICTRVCEEGVANGGIAGGLLTEQFAADIRAITGDLAFDGTLGRGYLVYAQSIATQPQSDRVQRKAPPIHIWLKSSGALHFVDINITLER